MSELFKHNHYDFNITEISYVVERKPNPEWEASISNPLFHILAFCTSGEAFYNFGEEDLIVKKDDLLFFPKNFLHSAKSSPLHPWSFITVGFDATFNSIELEKAFSLLDKHLSSHIISSLSAQFIELNHAWTGKRTGYLIKCKSLIFSIVYLLIKESEVDSVDTSHLAVIEKIRSTIEENYKNTYTVDNLANLSGLSSSHFRLLFKKITGFTIVNYQNNVKINKAKDFLLSGDCNVTEAALSVGFEDIYYFSRLFKKHTGTTPSEFMKG